MNHHLITLMVLLPLAGALLQAFVPSGNGTASGAKGEAVSSSQIGRWTALGSSLLATICGLMLVFSMNSHSPELQATETLPWIGSYAISYEMGIDGLNVLLVLLVSMLFPVLIAYEWKQKLGKRGMHGLFLLLQSAFFGAICAQDLFLQFFFWAFSAIPVYFLIGIWGGKDRESAAFRSFVTSAIGNALLFAALLLIYYSMDPHTFSLKDLAGGKFTGKTFSLLGTEISVATAAFTLISLGLALRIPVWPLHGWFTHVAEEAPPTVLVLLAGVSVPVATYIFIRLTHALFPETLGAAAHVILVVGALNLVAGALCAVAQRNLRTLLSFLCLWEVGLILLGIGSLSQAGLVGAVYQQLVVGLALAGLGLLAGSIAERAGHTAFLSERGETLLGGLAIQAPTVAVVAGVVVVSLLGFPGSGGFVGNSLIMIGSYSAQPVTVILAGVTLILGAYTLLTMYRHLFLGSARTEQPVAFWDFSIREKAFFLPLVGGLLAFGLYPKPLLELVRPTVLTLLSTVK